MTIRILIADDHGILRSGLCVLLNEQPTWQVVGEAADGMQALQMAEVMRPDVALIDVTMPGLDGIEVTRSLKQRQPQLRVLILTVHEDNDLLREAIQAGASGYVVKRVAQAELINAIVAVLRGDLYIHPSMTRALLASKAPPSQPTEESLQQLTRRETQVLALIAEGYTNLQIAEALVVSIRTVESHRANIMSKLNLHNRAELVQFALVHGFLKEE